MAEAASIKEPSEREVSFDLGLLKEEGLKKIQELSGNNWTDFNFHDPGVTILEILCYALSDLAYRADFDIADLLSTEGRDKPGDSLFPAERVLTTTPLSAFDFKKLFLDIEGVKNCAIVPSATWEVLPGAFDIRVELHPDFDNDGFRTEIRNRIHSVLREKTPVGLQFGNVTFLSADPVGVLLDIELSEEASPKSVFIDFVRCVQEYFSPEIKFRGLQELRDAGVPADVIFDGPVLNNGFLTDSHLSEHHIRQQVFVSDLMSGVMAIPGVSFVHELKLKIPGGEIYNWIYNVKPGTVPVLDPLHTKFTCRYRNTIVFQSQPGSASLMASAKLNRSSAHKNNSPGTPKGNSRNLRKYHSIQNDFPETYGIGPKGPPAGTSEEKLAAIRQLKGYLLIFDQVMANFLAQLDHVRYLFSTEDIEQSYAVQFIDEIPGIEFLYKQFVETYLVSNSNFSNKLKLRAEWKQFLRHNREKLTRQLQSARESREEFLKRRNTVLDHLLARFGIDTGRLEMVAGLSATEAIAHKLNLLRNFPVLSYEKNSGGRSSLSPKISGLKNWIAHQLNFRGATEEFVTPLLSGMLRTNRPGNGTEEVGLPVSDLPFILKNSTYRENIREFPGGKFRVYEPGGEKYAEIGYKGSREENAGEGLFDWLAGFNNASENFLLIDHIGLVPSPEMACFGFDINFHNRPFFISERNQDFEQCTSFIKELEVLAPDENNYLVSETANREFRISVKTKYGTLLSREFFTTETEAEDALRVFVASVRDDGMQHVLATRFEDHYTNLANPFSYIVTVLLPDWPSRFQREGFRTYIENFFYQNLPAHLAVNVRWVDFETMEKVEAATGKHRSETGSPREALEALTALMKLLESLP